MLEQICSSKARASFQAKTIDIDSIPKRYERKGSMKTFYVFKSKTFRNFSSKKSPETKLIHQKVHFKQHIRHLRRIKIRLHSINIHL